MNNFLLSAGAIIVLLGVVILVHEWGHFIVARACGVRVDVFSIGVGPRLWGMQRGATDYRLSALPVGGYVRMAGENPAEPRTGAPDEFQSKRRWQRALIIVAGPAMNVVLAILVATAMLMTGKGEPQFLHNPPLVSAVARNSPARQAGLRPDDVLVQVAGKDVRTWDDVRWQSMFAAPGTPIPVVVERAGRRLPFAVQPAPDSSLYDLFGYPAQQTVVDSVSPGLPAQKDGLQHGDWVVSVDGNSTVSPSQVAMAIQDSAGKPVPVTVQRAGRPVPLLLHPIYGKLQGQQRWYVGAYFIAPLNYRANRLSSAVSGGFRYNVMLTAEIVSVILKLVEHKAKFSKQLTGPVGIAEASSNAARQGLLPFLNIIAFISLDLGIVNLLPIPVLDGWHLLTLGLEGTMRRDLSMAVKERALQLGVIFLILLILLVTYNDILHIVTGNH